jgi:hypothetical protein
MPQIFQRNDKKQIAEKNSFCRLLHFSLSSTWRYDYEQKNAQRFKQKKLIKDSFRKK